MGREHGGWGGHRLGAVSCHTSNLHLLLVVVAQDAHCCCKLAFMAVSEFGAFAGFVCRIAKDEMAAVMKAVGTAERKRRGHEEAVENITWAGLIGF